MIKLTQWTYETDFRVLREKRSKELCDPFIIKLKRIAIRERQFL